jgi:hypothetical protein
VPSAVAITAVESRIVGGRGKTRRRGALHVSLSLHLGFFLTGSPMSALPIPSHRGAAPRRSVTFRWRGRQSVGCIRHDSEA